MSMIEKICRNCGKPFNGGPRAWYCPDCRAERTKAATKDYKRRKRAGSVTPLGSAITCPDCGKEFIKKGGLHQRCPECAAKHLKEIDNAQSLAWSKAHPDQIKESKRKLSRKRIKTDSIKKSGITGISWDKSTQRWTVSLCVSGKQIYVGKYKELADASAALKNFKNQG